MSFSVLNRGDAATLMAQLAYIYDFDAAVGPRPTAAALFTSQDGMGGSYTNGSIPAYAFYVADDQLVILVTGATIPLQGVGLTAGALAPMATRNGVNLNAYLLLATDAIVAAVRMALQISPASILLCGHSYGGAIAEALAVVMPGFYAGQPFQLLTFGAPRAGDNTLSAALAKIPSARYMNIGDPIPFFPPHFDEAPTLTIALGFPQASRLSNYVQPGAGIVLDTNGATFEATLPSGFSIIRDIDLLSWVNNQNGFLGVEHSYKTYRTRMASFTAPVLGPTPGPLAGLKSEVEPVLTPAIFNAGAVLGPALLTAGALVATISVYIPVNYRAKVVKQGNLYTITWMGLTIATGNTKSNARTLAKYINKWLRVQQTVASINNQAFRNAFIAYANVCSSNLTGFMPVLTVNP
jgi:pimeloyl-ACP methyl ester carboxylesterase